MKYLIVGLGNKGEEYAGTRHNIGFDVADALAHKLETAFSSASYGWIAKAKYRGRQVLLLKPDTYMNLSGKAIKSWMQKENIQPDHVMVITDDLSLPFGTLRMKMKGSDAGHNGLKSIQHELQTQAYPRLRFGIDSAFEKGRQVDYVLGKWTDEEAAALEERVNKASEAVLSFVFEGIQNAMTRYNGK